MLKLPSFDTSLSSIFTSDPTLSIALEQLSSVKAGQFDSALGKLTALSAKLSAFNSSNTEANLRANFTGRCIELSLEANHSLDALNKIYRVCYEIINLKNALQVEAVIFGSISPMLALYDHISKHPELNELAETIPTIFQYIHTDLSRPEIYIISLKPIEDWIDTLDLQSATQEFDSLLFSIITSYEIVDNHLHIPIYALPSKEFLEALMAGASSECKLLAQILYTLHLEAILQEAIATPRILFEGLSALLKEHRFSPYLAKKDLIPHLGMLIEKVEALSARGLEPIELLLDRDYIRDSGPTFSSAWLENSSDLFELISKIGLQCVKHFPLRGKARMQLEQDALTKGLDIHISRWADAMTLDRDIIPIKHLPYPISSRSPFCRSQKEFKLLPLYMYVLANRARDPIGKTSADSDEEPELVILPKKAASKPKAKAAVKAHGGAGAAAGGGGAGRLRDREPEPKTASLAKTDAKPKKVVSLSSRLSDSIEQTRRFLIDIEIHPRVKAWFKSKECGLRACGFGVVEHVLSQEQMILRHRFPKAILQLIFNPLFSRQSKWSGKGTQNLSHFESFVYINDQKYVLEATLNNTNQLYHLYARPIRKFHDFQTTLSASEYPSLPKVVDEETFEGMDESGITFDSSGDALIAIDSTRIKVLRLIER